jgi:hypothetical protein
MHFFCEANNSMTSFFWSVVETCSDSVDNRVTCQVAEFQGSIVSSAAWIWFHFVIH